MIANSEEIYHPVRLVLEGGPIINLSSAISLLTLMCTYNQTLSYTRLGSRSCSYTELGSKFVVRTLELKLS
jgi:hypothetical protein